ncbi:MAG: ATP-binding protein [Candidatus Nanopelagicales bacterium]
MTIIDSETKRKLREMGAPSLVEALEAHDDALTLAMPFAERIQLVVDDAHATFNDVKVEGLIRRAGLRYPNADLRRVDLIEQRGLDRVVIAQLGNCAFVGRRQNVVFQGFTGSGSPTSGRRWPSRPASTGTGLTTCGCPTWKRRGWSPVTSPAGRRSSCASTGRVHRPGDGLVHYSV